MASGLTLQPGQLLGRYRVLRHIGTGGMGAVYEAEHATLGKRCAIKVLAPEVAEDPGVAARLQREGMAAGRLRHPHVVDVYDIDAVDGVTFLVMEYLEGEDLAAYLRREGPLSPGSALDILLPVLDAVDAAHRSGIIHRDLKPNNIFLERDVHGALQPKVLDFGIARPFEQRDEPPLTVTGALLGTPRYMSPEQVSAKKELGPATDQYSLGVVLYEALVGASPFKETHLYALMLQVAQGEAIPPREAKPDLPEDLAAIILRAMALEPNDRFDSLQAMAKALLPFASPKAHASWSSTLERAPLRRPSPKPFAPPEVAAPAQPPASTESIALAPTQARIESGETNAAAGGTDVGTSNGPPLTSPSSAEPIVPPPRPRLWAFLAVGAAAVFAVALLLSRPENTADPVAPSPPPTSPIPLVQRFRISVEPPTARIVLDDEEPVFGELRGSFRPGETNHRLVITLDGYVTQIITFRNAPPIERVVLQPIRQP